MASKHNKQLLVSAGHHDPEQERDAIRSLIDRRCDALIIHAKALADYHVMELLESQSAAVLINRYIDSFSARCIYLDNRIAGEIATNYLIEQGYRRIAHLTHYSVSKHLVLEDARERHQGYQGAMIAHGIVPEKNGLPVGNPMSRGAIRRPWNCWIRPWILPLFSLTTMPWRKVA